MGRGMEDIQSERKQGTTGMSVCVTGRIDKGRQERERERDRRHRK